MSTGRGIAVANIESVKHGIEKDSWIVARGVRSTVKSSSGNRVMHECFVFGPDHEELAKNVALKLFGDGETPPSELSPEMMITLNVAKEISIEEQQVTVVRGYLTSFRRALQLALASVDDGSAGGAHPQEQQNRHDEL